MTIHDVARRARVSIATASRVLNGAETVRPDLARRVLAAITALDYRPNRVARRLRASTSQLWALIVPDFENVFFTRLSRGLEDVARLHDRCVFLGSSDDEFQKERRYLELALAERVGGLVIAPAEDDTDLSELIDAGVPVVVVDRPLVYNELVDTVISDNIAGGRLAAEHLQSRGYRKVACIAGPPNPTSSDRLRGFVRYVETSAPGMEVSAVIHGDNRFDGGYDAMGRLLMTAHQIDAIFVTNNLMTFGALKALAIAGVRVPSDLGVIGFDVVEFFQASGIAITSVNQDSRLMGRLAGERILSQRRPQSSRGQLLSLTPQLVVGESTPSRNVETTRAACQDGERTNADDVA